MVGVDRRPALSAKRRSDGPRPRCPATCVDNGKADAMIAGRENGRKAHGVALIGYARVSTAEQNLSLQHDALVRDLKALVEPTARVLRCKGPITVEPQECAQGRRC